MAFKMAKTVRNMRWKFGRKAVSRKKLKKMAGTKFMQRKAGFTNL